MARPPPWSPTASDEEVRAFLHRRLALFSKLLFWTFVSLVAFVVVLYEARLAREPRHFDLALESAAVGITSLVIVWYFWLHRRADLPIDALYRIDALYTIFIGIWFALSAYFQQDLAAAAYSSFIFLTFGVFTRVVVIPSSARRTGVVTAISYVPLCVVSALMQLNDGLPTSALLPGTILYAAIAVVLAITGSSVIYGLRRQVLAARQLGQYTLAEKIGEGGMGAVYRARHAMLRRPTAIKLLRPDKHGVDGIARFEREVQHMSRLTHPNTVAVFDYGKSPDGVFYYAMEYLDGVDLETLVRRHGPQPAPRVVHILRQVCAALDEAHAMGLTHRDIKPANVILCRRGRTPDVAKVVDFGLVAETRAETRDTTTAIMGTPAYLAPEAVTDPSSVGPRSDLYALGAVGYFLLSGHRVFDGKSVVELCVQHATETPRPLAAHGVDVPAELEALIMACLAKDPAERPASARVLRLALGALPAYRDWDEAAALAWWDELEARRAAQAPDAGLSMTITVDVTGRTQESG